MNEKQISKKWYLKGAKDADETSKTKHIEKDFETHFEIQYTSSKECANVIIEIDKIINESK